MKKIILGILCLMLFSCNESNKIANQYLFEKIGNDSIYYKLDSSGYFTDSMKFFSNSNKHLAIWDKGIMKGLFVLKNEKYQPIDAIEKISDNGNSLTFFKIKDEEIYVNGPCRDSSFSFFANFCKIEGIVRSPKDTSIVIVRNIIPSLAAIQHSRLRKEFIKTNEDQILKFKVYPEDSLRVGVHFAGVRNYIYKAFPIPRLSASDSIFLKNEDDDYIKYGDFIHKKVVALKSELLEKGYVIENCKVVIDNSDILAKSFFMFVVNKIGEKFEIEIILSQKIKVGSAFCDDSKVLDCEIVQLAVKPL